MEIVCSVCAVLKGPESFYLKKDGTFQAHICKPCWSARYYKPRRVELIARNNADKRRRLGRPGRRQLVCGWCGAEFHGDRKVALFCSSSCKDKARKQAAKDALVASKPQRFCVNCDAEMPKTMRVEAKFCSSKCNDAAHAIVRKMAKRANSVKPRGITKATIGNRDGWLCGLCGGTVDKARKHPDPLCPSIDHIVPLALGGTNELTNLQISHLACNVRKQHRLT